MSTLFRYIFLTSMGLILMACGNSRFEARQSHGQRTFVTEAADEKSGKAYHIELRGQQFENTSPTLAPPNELSQSLQSALYENEVFEIHMPNKAIKFQLDLERGLRFNELDETGNYSINGYCNNYDCQRAAFSLQDIEAEEEVELLYSRTYEYLVAGDETKIEDIDDSLIAEAIEYRFPIARHSLRINGSRDLDRLVIQRPKVDRTDENFEVIVEIGDDERRDEILSATIQLPREDRAFEDRLELEGSGQITVTIPRNSITDIPNESSQLRLTPNPYEAYDIELPDRLFSAQHIVDAQNPMIFQTHFAFMPVNQQRNFEPAQRIAAIAKAFVDQQIKVFQNACNHYVRAVMALAGYTEGGHYVSNNFHNIFRRNSQGLRGWDLKSYDEPSQNNKTRITNDLSQLHEQHGVIYQVIRTGLGRAGHTGILVKEGNDIVIYDSSWKRRPPRRRVVDPRQLINGLRPKVNLHSYPEVMGPSSRTHSI